MNAVQFWHLFSMALLQGGLMHLRLTRCWPHTKKLHVCEADYFSTCNSDMCLVTVRLIILSCLLECHINIYLSDHMLWIFFFFYLLLFIFYLIVYIYIYVCVCVCVCVCVFVYICVCVCVWVYWCTVNTRFNRNVWYKTGFVYNIVSRWYLTLSRRTTYIYVAQWAL